MVRSTDILRLIRTGLIGVSTLGALLSISVPSKAADGYILDAGALDVYIPQLAVDAASPPEPSTPPPPDLGCAVGLRPAGAAGTLSSTLWGALSVGGVMRRRNGALQRPRRLPPAVLPKTRTGC